MSKICATKTRVSHILHYYKYYISYIVKQVNAVYVSKMDYLFIIVIHGILQTN